MTYTILCAQNHLILDQPRCLECGWVRPIANATGQLAWGPVELGGGLGGSGSGLAPLCVGTGTGLAALPMRGGAIRLVRLENGQVAHSWPIEPGLVVRSIVADGKRMLMSLCDERSLELARNGCLVIADPTTQKLEKVWEASSHALSAAVVCGDVLLVRTSLPEMVALDRRDPARVKWRTPLDGGLLHTPLVVAGMVVACSGQTLNYDSSLAVYSLDDGKLRWKKQVEDLINFDPPAVAGTQLIFRSNKTGLTFLDMASQQVRKLSFDQIYSPPVMGRWLYLVARGNPNSNATDHYILQAFDPRTLQEQWRLPLPDRFRQFVIAENDLLLLGGDHGTLMAIDGGNARELWRYAWPGREDPLRTALAFDGTRLLAGTYSGKLFAIQAVTLASDPGDPDLLLAKQDIEGAAAAYAVRKNYRKAADLYAGIKDRLREALVLYDKNCDYELAGQLALREAERQSFLKDVAKKESWLAEALKYYQQTQNYIVQAEIHQKLGDDLSAARCYEKAGDLLQAAQWYEKAKYYDDAARLYRGLNRSQDLIRLRNERPLKFDDLQLIEKQDGYLKAGEIALSKNMFREAVDIYNRNKDEAQELLALEKLVDASPEPWSVNRLLDLARQSGQFYREACLWEKHRPKQNDKAADAFWRAALQTEYSTPRDEAQVAFLYEKAQGHYLEAGASQEAQKCVAKIREYRHSPVIKIGFVASRGFTEDSVSRLDLTITNCGWGKAQNIRFSVDSSYFKFDDSGKNRPIKALARGRDEKVAVYIKALSHGEAVPLDLRWDWEDENGVTFCDQIVHDLPVSSPQSGSTPQQVTYNIGVINQAEKMIQGDNIEAGGQKGDKVVQEFTSGESDTPAPVSVPSLCPICRLPLEPDAKFCTACGNPLAG